MHPRAVADTVGSAEMALPDGTHSVESTAKDDFDKSLALFHSMIHRNEELLLHLHRKSPGEIGSSNNSSSMATTQSAGQVSELDLSASAWVSTWFLLNTDFTLYYFWY